MMSSVNTQIQRAISDAISSQILPQIQSALSTGLGHSTQNKWNVPSERPEANSEVLQNASSRDNSRSKPNRDRTYDGPTDIYRRYREKPQDGNYRLLLAAKQN